MAKLTEGDIRRKLRAVAHAIAQQEPEGLKVTDSTVSDLNRAARGEIEVDDIIRNIHSRVHNVRYSGNDPYLDPATGVLRNRLGISNETAFEQTEADVVAARSFAALHHGEAPYSN